MTLLERIKFLCNEYSETLASLERKMDFGNGTIRRWSNALPSADKLAKLANFFHVSVDYLLGRTDFPNDFLLSENWYPNILKQFAKGGDSSIVISVDSVTRQLSAEELGNLTIAQFKETIIQFNPEEKNPLTELMALLPRPLRDAKMSLYDLLLYISNDPHTLAILKRSGLNESGELTIPSDIFDKVKTEYTKTDLPDTVHKALTTTDLTVAHAYHNANDGIQSSVRKLLDVDDTTTPTPSP